MRVDAVVYSRRVEPIPAVVTVQNYLFATRRGTIPARPGPELMLNEALNVAAVRHRGGRLHPRLQRHPGSRPGPAGHQAQEFKEYTYAPAPGIVVTATGSPRSTG
jgi:hypothetical protein